MELRDALTQIAEIRQKVAQTELFRGYRALPVAFSGLLALVAACCQRLWLPEPEQNMAAYFALWVGAALLSMLATGIEMAWFVRRSGSVLERHKTYLAVTQFLPCVGAGGLLMLVLIRHAPDSLWMLPGLWAMLFGLGIFASCRLLPPALIWAGIFYLGAGALCLAVAQGEYALSPWAMGLPFGVGQLLTAALLYWTLERYDGENQETA
jgi:hypothetical protein